MRSSSSRQARKESSRSAVPSDKLESRSAMTAACASNVAAAVRSRPGFDFARGASPAKTARVMKPLVERPEAWTRAANSARRSAGGRYEMGGARFFRAMAATVGGRHAALPRAFPARLDPQSATRPLRRRVDGFPKGEPTSPLWSKPVPKHRSGSRGTKAAWSRVARGYEVPFAHGPWSTKAPGRRCNGETLPQGGPRGTGRSPWQGARGITTHTLCSLPFAGLLIPV